MNCVVRALEQAKIHPERMALWTPSHGSVCFQEMLELSLRAQKLFYDKGIRSGDHVLLAITPGPEMFASILALLGLGAPVLLIEPWLKVERINHIVNLVKPKAFITGALGRVWGMRSQSIRKIPNWISPRQILKNEKMSSFHIEQLDPTARAILAFTSGTTGASKGIIRSQQYLWDMHEIISAHEDQGYSKPDLSVFANLALYHLGTGRGAVLVPHNWNTLALNRIAALPKEIQPETLTCGPGFLQHLLKHEGFSNLKSFYVGGALTDCSLFEEAFSRFTSAKFHHVYGGSEAEPVASIDARSAVKTSRESGYFQTLHIGKPISVLTHRIQNDSLWVAGPNVCPEYLDAPEENRALKETDNSGRVWHNMGDRVLETDSGWKYSGRSQQSLQDFDLEQKIYSLIGSSKCFIHRNTAGEATLVGEQLGHSATMIKRTFHGIDHIVERTIKRDKRHRARIDRAATTRGFKQ